MTKALTKNGGDFTSGPIFLRLLTYSIPIMLTSILQIVYNMADNIVIGQFSGDDLAFAAISSTGSITSTFVNIMIGFSLGTGILIAQYYGAKNDDAVSRSVHTSMALSVIIGIGFAAIALLLLKPLFVIISVPDDIYDSAMLYVKIILIGIPAQSIYNFAASILRSVGDSQTPLTILAISGLINVVLNLLFVIVFKMSVAGVALATVISQYASALAVIIILTRRKACYRLQLRRLRLEGKILLRITRLGLPSAIQSAAFNLSSMVLSKSINELGSVTIAAFGLSNQIEALCYSIMNSFQASAMTFTAQNFGAMKIKRIKRVSAYSIFWVSSVGLSVGLLVLLFSEPIANLYLSSDNLLRDDIIAAAKPMLTVIPLLLLHRFYRKTELIFLPFLTLMKPYN